MTPTEFAALAVAWLLSATRTLQATKAAWGIIPPRWQWVPVTLLAAVTELGAKLATGVHSWMDVAVPVLLVVATALPGARSNVHAALAGLVEKAAADTDNPLRPSTVEAVSRGSMPVAKAATGFVGLVMFALGVALSLPGCSSSPVAKDPTALGATARKDAQLTYAIAVVSLTALDDIHAAWLDGLAHPTDDQLAAAEKVTAALKLTRDKLAAARPWIQDGQGDESKAKEAITQGIDAATLAGELLGQLGAKVPDPLLDALNAARAALGGEK